MTGANFPIRDTSVGLTAYRTGGNYGQAVSTADQQSGDPSNYVNLVDDGTDLAGDGTTTDIQYNTNLIAQGQKVDVTNQNLARITLKQVQPEPGSSLTAAARSAFFQLGLGSAIRQERQCADQFDRELKATGVIWRGYLTAMWTFMLKGCKRTAISRLHTAISTPMRTDKESIHTAIADISLIDGNGNTRSALETDEDLLSELSPPSDGSSLADVYQSLDLVEYRTQIAGLNSGQIQQVTVASDAGDQYKDAMTDYSGGAVSSLYGVLVDNGGQALTSSQQAEILSDYNVNALDPPGGIEVKVATPAGDLLTRKVQVATWAIKDAWTGTLDGKGTLPGTGLVTGTYTGTVVAKGNATLKKLAEDITGNELDWVLLVRGGYTRRVVSITA